jgi:alpha-L-fucosidase
MTFLPERGSLDARPVPDWYTDAKLGIFVHWGLYSVPAFAERTDGDYTAFMRDLTAGKDTKGRIPYAEWYLNALRVPGSPTARYHQATYGRDVSYFDFRRQFQAAAAEVDFADWARLFAAAGARYVSWSAGTWTATRCGPPRSPTRTCRPSTGRAGTWSAT